MMSSWPSRSRRRSAYPKMEAFRPHSNCCRHLGSRPSFHYPPPTPNCPILNSLLLPAPPPLLHPTTCPNTRHLQSPAFFRWSAPSSMGISNSTAAHAGDKSRPFCDHDVLWSSTAVHVTLNQNRLQPFRSNKRKRRATAKELLQIAGSCAVKGSCVLASENVCCCFGLTMTILTGVPCNMNFRRKLG